MCHYHWPARNRWLRFEFHTAKMSQYKSNTAARMYVCMCGYENSTVILVNNVRLLLLWIWRNILGKSLEKETQVKTMEPKKLSTLRQIRPTLFMIGGLIGLHYGWFVLQQNEKLVPKEEQLTEQPIVTVGVPNVAKCVFHWEEKTIYSLMSKLFPF